jgi:uncharacterized protein (DUF433 family)
VGLSIVQNFNKSGKESQNLREGTRIPVEDVLELIQENIPFTEIIGKYYPDLEIEDIKACVRYATDLVRSEEIHAEVA